MRKLVAVLAAAAVVPAGTALAQHPSAQRHHKPHPQHGTAGGGTKILNAARACRAERAEDPEAFHTTYGTGHNGRNAFGKCVAQHTRGHTS